MKIFSSFPGERTAYERHPVDAGARRESLIYLVWGTFLAYTGLVLILLICAVGFVANALDWERLDAWCARQLTDD